MHGLLLLQGWDGGQRIGLGDAAAGVVGLRRSWGSLSESLGDISSSSCRRSSAKSCHQGDHNCRLRYHQMPSLDSLLLLPSLGQSSSLVLVSGMPSSRVSVVRRLLPSCAGFVVLGMAPLVHNLGHVPFLLHHF